MAAGQVVVVEGWDLQTHKTKALAATLEKIGVKGSALLVGAEMSPKLLLAAGNNPKLRAIESLGVNVYELLKHDQVVFSKEAVLALQEVVKP
jgi:large subunit ribosomal protein L4